MGLERTHAKLLGQGEGLAVVGWQPASASRGSRRCNVAEEAQSIRLVAAFLVRTSKCQRTLGKGRRLLRVVGPASAPLPGRDDRAP